MRRADAVPVMLAGPALAGRVAEVIARASVDLPVARWLVPEPGEREQVLRDRYRIWVEHAVQLGHVDLLADSSAAAVWFDCRHRLPAPPDYAERLYAACGPYTERFIALDALLAHHHPGFAHEHLAFLAVLPGLQGTGRARTLLEHRHERPRPCRGAGLPRVGLRDELGLLPAIRLRNRRTVWSAAGSDVLAHDPACPLS